MAGVTNNGFEQKRLAEVIADMETQARNNFGGGISTDVNSVLGRTLRVVAQPLSDLWEANEQVYDSFFVDRAQGVSLDALVALTGISRFPASPTTCPVLLTAVKDTVIPAGSIVSSSYTGTLFETTSTQFFNLIDVTALQIEPVNAIEGDVYSVEYNGSVVSHTALATDTVDTIASALSTKIDSIVSFNSSVVVESNRQLCYLESVDPLKSYSFTLSSNLVTREVTKVGNVKAYTAGSQEQPVGTIDTVASPVGGWLSVTNPVDATPGRNRESDTELRIRFANSKEARAGNTLEAMYSDLQGLEGLEKAMVYENDTNEVDIRGFPPHSMVVVVEGANSLDIAQSIWKNKPAGIQTHGNTTVSILDSQGSSQSINFIRPVEVPIYITVTITTSKGFASDGIDQIKQEIIDYINKNYSIGDDVVYSRLYTPLNRVGNHQVDSLVIGTTSNPTGTVNIEVPFDGIPRTQISYITVNT